MKNILFSLLITAIAIVLSEIFLVFIYERLGNAGELDVADFIYAIFLGGGQMFLPFLAYVIVCHYFVKKLIEGVDVFMKHSALAYALIYIDGMLLIVLIMTIGEILISGVRKGWLQYLNSFSLFITFSLLSSIFAYFFRRRFLGNNV